MVSRWADSAEDEAEAARKKAEKEQKRRRKAEKEEQQRSEQTAAAAAAAAKEFQERPAKRRRISQPEPATIAQNSTPRRPTTSGWQPCRPVEAYHTLNAIEEGSYGHVYRAKDRLTSDIVAIKKLKTDPMRDAGFPVTALREIQCLQRVKHRHVIELREVVTDAKDVYLVMDFIEHDLKSLQEEIEAPFMISEVKTLMLQLARAVEFLHDHWILHRDLKTSNILMNNRGEIKIADFGMARLCGDPPPRNLTQLVVTLWYRAPELLLGTKTYDSAIDIWSLGCIFGELLLKSPILMGKNEIDQIAKIYELCGEPNEDSWPGYKTLPNTHHMRLNKGHTNTTTARFPMLTPTGLTLLNDLLALDPSRRPTAKAILSHAFFSEKPRPKPTAMLPTFPSKAGQERRRRHASPHAPMRGDAAELSSR